jgi:Kef-type K+ transport system membrane component KefB/mannitol/fructose-specific phosphotransferase system IIA component (Ntr-type)
MEYNQVLIYFSLGVLLAAARLLGEVTKKLGLTSVLGEILAGVLLGPSCLGAIAPELWQSVFPLTGSNASVLQGLTSISIVLFLLLAGMEVDLSAVWRQGKTVLVISAAGIIVPFVVGSSIAAAFPAFLGVGKNGNTLVFALFWGTALSISALPVIARTLIDLNLYRTVLGMIVIPSAVLQDLVGWCVFAVILSMIGVSPHFTTAETLGLAILFAVFALTIFRKLLNRLLPLIQAHWTWPGGIIGFGVAAALLAAAFTEWIGIHGLFGAFLVGIALGDSKHMSEQTRFAFASFISYFFAPLFFASIGIGLDFRAHFDFPLVLVVIVIASLGKIAGTLIGGKLGGLSRRDSLAIGYAMNSRGAMEIILGLAALKYGVVSEKTFVALVVMAVVTSLMSGPLIKHALHLKRRPSFANYVRPRAFCRFKESISRNQMMGELVAAIADTLGKTIDSSAALEAVLKREDVLPTGIGNGVAIPHARIEGITEPHLAVGISEQGIDFDAPDGKPARLIFLLLVPISSDELPLQIMADIAETFSDEKICRRALAVGNFTEFLALVKLGHTDERLAS